MAADLGPTEREERLREQIADIESGGKEQYREDIDVRRMVSDVVIDDIVPPSSLRTELEDRFAFYEDAEKD